jgi:hypothetical protein
VSGKIDNRYGNFDGAGSQARFGEIWGLVKDRSGTLYVLDRVHQRIRKIAADGAVSTHFDLVGTVLPPSWYPDTPLPPGANLKHYGRTPAVAIGQTNNFYLIDPQLSIRRVSPSGQVSTVATQNEIKFHSSGVTNILGVDGDEVLYLTDGTSVRKIFPDGRIVVLAGLAGSYPMPDGKFVDGQGDSARFVNISEMVVQPDGTVYVCDDGYVIRKISVNGSVTTLAGAPRAGGFWQGSPGSDGQGRDAEFSLVTAMAAGSDGSVFVKDLFSVIGPPEVSRIRKISPSGQVTTLFTQKSFLPAYGMQVNADGSFYLAHQYHVSHVDAAGNTKVLAGSSDYSVPAVANGPLGVATFADPIQVRVGSAGAAYVLENLDLLRPVSADGLVSAQTLTPPSFEDLVYFKDFDRNSQWRLGGVDAEGQLYFSVAYRWLVVFAGTVNVANVVAKRSPTGLVSTLWSERSPRVLGYRTITGLSADRAGTLLVSFGSDSSFSDSHQRLSNSGQSLGEPTLPGLAGAKVFKAQGSGGWLAYGCSVQPAACWIRTLGSSGEILSSAPFVPPPSCNGSCVVSDLAQDAKGNTYLTVPTSHRVFKVSSSGEVSTFLGKAGSVGITLGPAPASLHTPKSIDIDSNGMMYLVADRALLKLQLPN